MSKQGDLFGSAYRDWQHVYQMASEEERRIVDFVMAHPDCTAAEIAVGLELSLKVLSWRLWELSGGTTAAYRSDGLLVRTRVTWGHGLSPRAIWRYRARNRIQEDR